MKAALCCVKFCIGAYVKNHLFLLQSQLINIDRRHRSLSSSVLFRYRLHHLWCKKGLKMSPFCILPGRTATFDPLWFDYVKLEVAETRCSKHESGYQRKGGSNDLVKGLSTADWDAFSREILFSQSEWSPWPWHKMKLKYRFYIFSFLWAYRHVSVTHWSFLWLK